MGKDSKKHLVGQPIFKQIINILPRDKFEIPVKKTKGDRYYKPFSSWDEPVTMLFGIFSRCGSMGGVCDSMRALGGKLNHPGMDCSPAKSTAGDALRNRSEDIFKQFYRILIKHFQPLLSVSRKEDVKFKQFYAFDSTTIPCKSIPIFFPVPLEDTSTQIPPYM
jgi:hypothetical protein